MIRTVIGRLRSTLRWAAGVFVTVLALAAGTAALYAWKGRAHAEADAKADPPPPGVTRVGTDAIAVPLEVVRSLDIHTAPAAAARPRPLPPLTGTLYLDTNHYSRARPRFAGEVVALGGVSGRELTRAGSDDRPLQPGDPVKAGQLLAVIWCKDLGEKKSELVDALSKLKSDLVRLEGYREAARTGGVAERTVLDAQRDVDADRVAVDKAERTLRTWRLSDAEIDAVKAEADKLSGAQGRRGIPPADWARVEVRAALGGVILEKNVQFGDIVDVSTDLYRLADLSRLVVWAAVYEEDLPTVRKLTKPLAWTVRMPSNPNFTYRGVMEQVNPVIDPNQHTALATGYVDNADGGLSVGQAVSVTIEVPPGEGEVEVPTAALVEDGRRSVVFVQPDPVVARFERRPVEVVRRYHDFVVLRKGVTAKDLVVTGGALLLNAALDDLPMPGK